MSSKFLKYVIVGLLNTAVHWACFFVLTELVLGQGFANLLAFVVSVTVSFFVNARFTFNARTSTFRYISYVSFLGCLAFAVGVFAETVNAPRLTTLVGFSTVSLVVGFLLSKFFVFVDSI